MMPMPRPLVSLGIPVYNGESSIAAALDDLLAQTYDNIEFVISDNGSTDGTSEICREYAARDSRIKYYRNPTNLGVNANYRRVVTLATGEYFMWAAVDDVKPHNAVELCVEALDRNPRAVMAHGIVLVRCDGSDELFELRNFIQALHTSPASSIRLFARGIEHNAMEYGLYRLNALRQATLGDHLGPEYLLLLQMCLMGEIEYVSAPLIIFRQRQPPPIRPPMYLEAPLTLRSLFNANALQRRKCWTVLLFGSYYIATRGNLPLVQRLKALAAHVTAHCSLYWPRLAKEVLFQLFQPIAWFCTVIWRAARRRRTTMWLARKLKASFIVI